MNEQVDRFQDNAKDQLHQATASSETFANGMKSVMEETASYSKRSMENTATFFQKLFGERSMENAVQLQTEYARIQYEDFIAQARKIGEIYQSMSKETMKPLQSAMSKGQDAMRH